MLTPSSIADLYLFMPVYFFLQQKNKRISLALSAESCNFLNKNLSFLLTSIIFYEQIF